PPPSLGGAPRRPPATVLVAATTRRSHQGHGEGKSHQTKSLSSLAHRSSTSSSENGHRRWCLRRDGASFLFRQAASAHRSAGPSASRRPSPTRLNDRGGTIRNRPGDTIIPQATVKIWPADASASIRPHEGVDWGTPTPRNDSAASNRMLAGISRV